MGNVYSPVPFFDGKGGRKRKDIGKREKIINIKERKGKERSEEKKLGKEKRKGKERIVDK